MAVNIGIAPPDFSTPVGKFRALVGDVAYEELDPPVVGYGSYQMFSDAEIEAFLESSDGSLEGAAYYAYLQMAASAALESKLVKDYDLQVDLTKRSADLRAVAAMWKDQWDSATADIFELFPLTPSGRCVPEATPMPVCRRGCAC